MRQNDSPKDSPKDSGMLKQINLHPLFYLLIGSVAALLLTVLLTTDGLLFQGTDPTWSAMQNSGRWRVGMDPSFPPFESLDAEGKPEGYDLDLAQALADEWDLQLEIVAIGFDSLPDALRTGQINSVISALPFDPRATKDVTYSDPYFEAGIRLAIRNADAQHFLAQDAYKQFIDEQELGKGENVGNVVRKRAAPLLKDQQVAVEWGSMGDMVGRQLQRLEATIELLPYETPDEAIAALQDDSTIDAVLIDNVTLRQIQAEHSSTSHAIVGIGPAIEGNPYVIALPHKATKLQREINNLLQMYRDTGKLSDLEKRWFSP